MNRQEKDQLVGELRGLLEGVQALIVTKYEGLDVPSMVEFRSLLRGNGAGFRVTKNSLLKRAVAETSFEGLGSHLVGMTGVAYTNEDPAAAAKVVTDFAKKHPALEVKAGWLEGGKILDASGVKALASLPSKDQLRGMLLGVLAGVPRAFVTVLSAPGRDFVGVLAARQRQLEETA